MLRTKNQNWVSLKPYHKGDKDFLEVRPDIFDFSREVLLMSDPKIDTAFYVKCISTLDNSIIYDGLDDLFEIAAKYADCISAAHSLPDANKRTALAVAIEFLSFNDFDLSDDNDLLADALRDLVLSNLSVTDFADILYAQYSQDTSL